MKARAQTNRRCPSVRKVLQMLSVVIPAGEFYLEKEGVFVWTEETTLRLEHSLLSVSKWEAKWKKPFLDRHKPKTYEESIDYIRCMTLTQNVDPNVYYAITQPVMDQVNAYIGEMRTATVISDRHGQAPNRRIVTSELIYYWMAVNNIPFECQKWHLSRLFTLLQIFDIKQGGDKKMSRSEIMSQNRALNAARRKAMKSKG